MVQVTVYDKEEETKNHKNDNNEENEKNEDGQRKREEKPFNFQQLLFILFNFVEDEREKKRGNC